MLWVNEFCNTTKFLSPADSLIFEALKIGWVVFWGQKIKIFEKVSPSGRAHNGILRNVKLVLKCLCIMSAGAHTRPQLLVFRARFLQAKGARLTPQKPAHRRKPTFSVAQESQHNLRRPHAPPPTQYLGQGGLSSHGHHGFLDHLRHDFAGHHAEQHHSRA